MTSPAELPRRPARRALMLSFDQQIDRRILQEADSLEAVGWSVEILALPLTERGIVDDPRVTRTGVPSATASAGPGSDADRSAVALAYSVFLRLFPANTGWVKSLKAALWAILTRWPGFHERFYVSLFRNALAGRAADLVIAHDLPMLPVGRWFAHSRGIPLVFDSHEYYTGQEMPAREARVWRRVERRHIGAAAAVVTVNRSIAELLEKDYALAQVHVVHNAVDPAPASAHCGQLRTAAGISPDAHILLYQGGLLAGRNIEGLIETMRFVSTPETYLVILGDGPEKERLVARAHRQEIGNRVRFLPAVPQQQLLGYTADATLGLIPYVDNCLNARFCTPNKLFEFIAAGLPIVGSDLVEIRNLIRSHNLGATCDFTDHRAVAQVLDDLLAAPGRLASLRESVARARTVVCWRVEGQRFREIVDALVPASVPCPEP